MVRVLLIFLLVLGVIAGGLMLLRRTANTPLPPEVQSRIDKRNKEEGRKDNEEDEDRRGW